MIEIIWFGICLCANVYSCITSEQRWITISTAVLAVLCLFFMAFAIIKEVAK